MKLNELVTEKLVVSSKLHLEEIDVIKLITRFNPQSFDTRTLGLMGGIKR